MSYCTCTGFTFTSALCQQIAKLLTKNQQSAQASPFWFSDLVAKHCGCHIIGKYREMLSVKTEALGVVYASVVLLMPEEHKDIEAYQISRPARTVAAEQWCWSLVRKIEISHWCNTNENLSRL